MIFQNAEQFQFFPTHSLLASLSHRRLLLERREGVRRVSLPQPVGHYGHGYRSVFWERVPEWVVYFRRPGPRIERMPLVEALVLAQRPKPLVGRYWWCVAE